MHIHHDRSSLRLLAAGIALSLTACSSSSDPRQGEDITLSTERNSGAVCLEPPSSGDLSFGVESIWVTGDRAVEPSAVRLVGADKITLVEARVVPLAHRGEFGSLPGWPGEGVSDAAAQALTPIPGTVVQPQESAGDAPGLLLHLRGQPGASLQGVQVEYRVAGDDEELISEASHLRLHVTDDCYSWIEDQAD